MLSKIYGGRSWLSLTDQFELLKKQGMYFFSSLTEESNLR